jgi:hypothetical protein
MFSYLQVMEADGRTKHYEIRLEGHLDARWAAWFDGLSLTNVSDGTTTISGAVVDQAALHGLLQKLRDVGMPLLSIIQVDRDPEPRGRTTPSGTSETEPHAR